MRLIVAAVLALVPTSVDEAAMTAKFCLGMRQQIEMPDGTEADCISATHAIEIEFTEKWAESLGQALHYSLWAEEMPGIGKRRAGIILVCRKRSDLCIDHAVRLYRLIDRFQLPVDVWDCDWSDPGLTACQKLTGPR
jgi:hypothetical protein